MWRSPVLAVFFIHIFVWRSVTARNGLLPNGNFEMGPKPWNMKGTLILGQNSLPYWRVKGIVEYITSQRKPQDLMVVVPEGTHAVRLGNEASIISRMVRVNKGSYYSLSFHAARTCAQSESLNVSVPPFWGEVPIQTVYSSNGWDTYAWGFRAPEDLVEFIIHNPGVQENPACGPVIDSVALKKMRSPRFSKFNLVKNGDFEEGPYVFPNASSGVLIPPSKQDAISPVPGWIVESLKAVKYVDARHRHFTVPQGNAAVELLAGRESVIAQIIRTVPGKKYILSFAVGDAGNKCQGKLEVEAFAGRETVKVPYESKGTGGFKIAQLSFTAVSERSRIAFMSGLYTMRSDDAVTFCGPVVDRVT
ncbi:hypothetical protein KI387_035562, partial [Taxus chinensis]